MNDSYFYIAKVTDNKDEDGLNRIKITAKLKEEVVSFWVPYLSCAAGNGIGFSSLPDIDDQVLVLAFGTSRDRQIALGSFWNENSAPPETGENSDADLNSDGNNSLNFFKSRAENLFIFDDTDGKEKIQMILSGKKTRFELDNENELINIETDKDFSINAKGKISIETEEEINFKAKKAYNIECEDFALKASKDANLESTKDMSLKGSGIALN